jgi:hypothetical protein
MADSPNVVCPVCDEPFRDRPTRCFRCGTNLQEWWPLEELLNNEEIVTVVATKPPPEASRRALWILIIVVTICAVSAGFFAGRFALRPTDLTTHPLSSARIAPPLPETTSVPPPESSSALIPGARPEPTPIPRVPQVVPEASANGEDERVLRYRVQKGDSAWRVAAALTGHGQNWQFLWPELKSKPVQVGSVLEVRVDRLGTLRQVRERR